MIKGLTKKANDQDKIIQRLQRTINGIAQIWENLRTIMEKDAARVNALEQEVKQLKVEGAKKDQLIENLLKDAEDN
jgi:hypothetical protein